LDKTVVIFIGVIKLFLQAEFLPENKFYHCAVKKIHGQTLRAIKEEK
jgi:hypothetical protein